MGIYDNWETALTALVLAVWVIKLVHDRRCRKCSSKDVRKDVSYGVEWRTERGKPFSHKLVKTKTVHRVCNSCGTPEA